MTFYQNCLGICIAIIIFSLCINLVGAMGVFPIGSDAGIAQNNTTADTTKYITSGYNPDSLFSIIFNIVTPAASLLVIGGLIFLLLTTHSAAVLGAYLFITIFWVSYGRAIAVLASLDVLSYAPMPLFIGVFTVVIGIIFMAAVIGMFTGNG